MVGQRRPEQIRRRASCPRHYSRLRCDRPGVTDVGATLFIIPRDKHICASLPRRAGINAGLRPVHFLDERISPSTSSLFNTQLATTRAPVHIFLRSYALEITVSDMRIVLFVSAKIQLSVFLTNTFQIISSHGFSGANFYLFSRRIFSRLLISYFRNCFYINLILFDINLILCKLW